MSVSDYWHLQRLDSTGDCHRQRLEEAHTWLQTQDTDCTDAAAVDLRSLQTHLLTQWQKAGPDQEQALLCLRCGVSHAIRQACLQLVSQFGNYYQFQGRDLFPLVLDDEGKPVGRYRPLGVLIVESYTPGKASLDGWAMHLTRNHPDLNQFLIERGLYRVSDWAILNDTAPRQLPKILGEFHSLTEAEVAAAQQLLERYHRVYRRDRLQPGRPKSRRRCLPPTETQLQAIGGTAPPQTVLGQLRQLAYWLRQYRIQVRGGTPLAESWEALDGGDMPMPQTRAEEDGQEDFLHTYRQQIQVTLEEALTTTLRAYCDKLRRKKSPQDRDFLKALELFHCQGESMTAIAPQIGLKGQVQVTRLMNLKRLRADVCVAWLPRLQSQVQDAVLAVTSVERLRQIGDRLEALLAEEIDRLQAEAESEAKIPHNRTAKSLFSRQLCASLHQFSPAPPAPQKF